MKVDLKQFYYEISLSSNNLRKFFKYLTKLQQVIGFGQCIEMVGNCKILIEIILKMKSIDNFKLNKILSEIRNIVESKFTKIKYIHVY